MESDLAQRMLRLWMSLLSIVASSSAFFLPGSPPPKGSSIDSDWSTKNKKQPGFLRLISAWYSMVYLHFCIMTRSFGALSRVNFRNLLRATLILRVPDITESSRFRYPRWSQTLTAARLREL